MKDSVDSKGDMSLVGPRSGLFNQQELTAARESKGVFNVRPGITGEAQVNAIDVSTPELFTLSKIESFFGVTYSSVSRAVKGFEEGA